MLPAGQGTALGKVAGGVASGLQNDPLGIRPNGPTGQHIGMAMPPCALDTGDTALGLAAHQVGRQPAFMAQLDKGQPRIQQRGKHLLTVARDQGTHRHGPLAHPPGAVPPLQQAAIASALLVSGLCQHMNWAGNGYPLLPGILTPAHCHQGAQARAPHLEPCR
ncbi:hypothetical protein D3C81_1732000 [compost metagenome]